MFVIAWKWGGHPTCRNLIFDVRGIYGGKKCASHWNSKNICLENIRTEESQKSLGNSSTEKTLENMRKVC